MLRRGGEVFSELCHRGVRHNLHFMMNSIKLPALWDKTISKVSLPGGVAGSNDSDIIERVAETACYTRLAEPYMVEQYATSEEFWAKYDVQPSWAYFGAHDGLYTAVPAIYQKACGELRSSPSSMVRGRIKRPQGCCISHRHQCIEEHVQVWEDEHRKGRRGNHC